MENKELSVSLSTSEAFALYEKVGVTCQTPFDKYAFQRLWEYMDEEDRLYWSVRLQQKAPVELYRGFLQGVSMEPTQDECLQRIQRIRSSYMLPLRRSYKQ
jgi:hypothetical protein